MSDLSPLTLDEIQILLEAAEVAQIPGHGHYDPPPLQIERLCRALLTERQTTAWLRRALTLVGVECANRGLNAAADIAREALWPGEGDV